MSMTIPVVKIVFMVICSAKLNPSMQVIFDR
jgi:hypothetical protein